MNILKSLVAAATLTLALAVSAAGETPICNPGETHTPPCSARLAAPEEPVVGSGAASTVPEAQNVEIVSLVELALYALMLA